MKISGKVVDCDCPDCKAKECPVRVTDKRLYCNGVDLGVVESVNVKYKDKAVDSQHKMTAEEDELIDAYTKVFGRSKLEDPFVIAQIEFENRRIAAQLDMLGAFGDRWRPTAKTGTRTATGIQALLRQTLPPK